MNATVGAPYGTLGVLAAVLATRCDRDARGGREARADRAKLAAPIKEADGRVRGELVIAKVGTLEYDDDDAPGGIRVEHVDAETLNDPAANESLKLRTLVWEHPSEDVRPETANLLRIGQLGEKWRFDGEYLIFSYVIDTDVGLRVLEMGLRETSPGYTVSLVKRADGSLVQRDRRYNHHAVTVAARGGPDVHLRADGANNMDPEKILALIRELRKDSATADGGKLTAIETAIADLAKRLDAKKNDGDDEPDEDDGFVKVKKTDFDDMKKKCDSFDEMMKKKEDTKRGDSDDALSLIRDRRRLDGLALAFGVDEKTVEGSTTSALRLALAKRIDSTIDEKNPPAPAYLDGLIATAAKIGLDGGQGGSDGLSGLRFDGATGADRGRREDSSPDLMGEQIKGYGPKT